MITAPGIYNLPADVYHADPCPIPSLSSSIAKILLDQSPKHAWWSHPRLNPNFEPEESANFDLGGGTHSLILEQNMDAIVIVDAADWRTKAAREQRDIARAAGKKPMLVHQFERAKQMGRAMLSFMETTELYAMLETALVERSIFWPEDDIWCRIRPDILSADYRVCVDFKSTENAAPDVFIRQIERMRYDVQAELYTRGIKAVTGVEPVFVFLAQETRAPYSCSLVGLSNAYRVVGQRKVNHAMRVWQHCTTANNWSGYTNEICYAEPRPYQLADVVDGGEVS